MNFKIFKRFVIQYIYVCPGAWYLGKNHDSGNMTHSNQQTRPPPPSQKYIVESFPKLKKINVCLP